MQIISVGVLNPYRRNLSDPQWPAAGEMDRAVDLRRISPAAALRAAGTDLVDDDLFALADPPLQLLL